ncbi:alpha/beta fold hydrolase [Actinomadura nitritigenes]|uniref:alpha/beta fold hydrolase n=1 Tax=Actinomadura nitritigenes TaxID=134602 RepID=UPI003D936B48
MAPPSPAGTQEIAWRPCPDADGVECATITVPLDWAEPGGDTVSIGLARRKATGPGSRIGSVILHPGGPGMSGVDVIKQKKDVFTPAVSARFDVIGYDPRGISTSTQVTCDPELLEQAQTLKARAGRSSADFDAFAKANTELSEDCRRRTGPLYDHLDDRQVVRDVDAIRAALGENKITQVGYSYGTLTGQQYAQMFPQHVRAMVDDGNMDHSIGSIWDFLDAQTAAIEKNFVQWADWCDRTPDCALYGQDAKKVYAELRERAKNGTLKDPDTGEQVDFVALTAIAQAANLPEYWTRLAGRLKNLYDGKSTTASPTGAPTPTTSPSAPPVALQNYPRQAMFCQDWTFRVSGYTEFQAGLARLSERYPNVNWNPNATEAALDCVGYRGQATNPQAPLQNRRTPPLVMVGNVNDYATVYPWSRNAATQSGATLLTYEGFGHTVYPSTVAFGSSTCVNDAIDAYLINLKLPGKGLRCPGIEVPGGGEPPSPTS